MKIIIQELEKSFKKNQALNKVNLSLESGHMHGIIGPEGAGKTTLLRVILHLLKADKGTVHYYTEQGPVCFEEIRAQIAYMPQQQSLYADLSIREHLRFFQALHNIPNDQFSHKTQELLQVTRLGEFLDRPAGKLSGGMYKKLGLMCALLCSPKIIFLDEPTNGVDPISRREFWDLLYRLMDREILIVLTTSYMDEAERCGRVHLLEAGEILGSGPPRDLLRSAGVSTFDEYYLNRGKA